MGSWLKKVMGIDEQDDSGLGCLCGRREASPGEAGMRDRRDRKGPVPHPRVRTLS